MIDPTPIGPHEDRSPKLTDYDDVAYWVAARVSWAERHPELFAPEHQFRCERCRDSGWEQVDARGVGTYRRCAHDPAPWQEQPEYHGELAGHVDRLERGHVLWLCERDAGDAQTLAVEVSRRLQARGQSVSLLTLADAPSREDDGGWSRAAPRNIHADAVVVREVHAGRSYHQCVCLAKLLGDSRGRTIVLVGTDPEQLGERSREAVMAAVRARHGAVRGVVSQVRR